MPQDEEVISRKVNFAKSTWEALLELARQNNESEAEALRDAIALSKWFHDSRRFGVKILTEYPNGTYKIVVKM